LKKEEIHLGDIKRILIGNAPWEFMGEVFLRTIIIYLILIIIMRLLGKRMSAQLTVSELAVVVTLGAIVSVPMEIPDKGLLQGIILLLVVLLFQRGLNLLAFNYRKVELISQGELGILIKDGILNIKELSDSTLSREALFAELRRQKINQLGEIKRAYLEACGIISIFKNEAPGYGLSIMPENDKTLQDFLSKDSTSLVCNICGFHLTSGSPDRTSCNNCHQKDWVPSVK
jgi:uncharacterized membrane protein YcaP (DUF421 family)